MTSKQTHTLLSALRTRGLLISTPVGKYVKWYITPAINDQEEDE
jgi:hypothetical protein